jgi:hypothetical protein
MFKARAEARDFCSGGGHGYAVRLHSAMMLSGGLRQEVDHGDDRAEGSARGAVALSAGRVTAPGGRCGDRQHHAAPPRACALVWS